MLRDYLVTSDGTRLAFQLEGDPASDAPALVLTNGLTSSTHFWHRLRPLWAARHRVLTWDLPGHGESGPAQSPRSATIDGLATLLLELMDAVGIERAVQVGWSTGCQVVFELYRAAPFRCTALVCLLGGPGHVLDTADLPLPGPAIERLARHMPRRLFSATAFLLSRATHNRGGHALGRRLGLLGPEATDDDVRAITAHLKTLHGPTVQAMLCSAQSQSAHELLDRIDVPLLVVAGDLDPFAPSEAVGVPLHRAVASSELLRLPGGTHTALLDHATEIGEAVEAFLARRHGG